VCVVCLRGFPSTPWKFLDDVGPGRSEARVVSAAIPFSVCGFNIMAIALR
jgi:hypothetical protein